MKKNKNNDNHIEAGNSKREGLKMPLHAEISSQSSEKSVAGSTTNKSILNTGRFFSGQIPWNAKIVTPETIEDAIKYYLAGHSYIAAAKEYGMGKNKLLAILKSRGLTRTCSEAAILFENSKNALPYLRSEEGRSNAKRIFSKWVNSEKCREWMRNINQRIGWKKSKYHCTLSTALQNAGTNKTDELLVPFNKGAYSIDIAIESCKLAVEVDGYFHTAESWDRLHWGKEHPAIRDARKDDYLQSCGWTVLRIPTTRLKTNEGVLEVVNQIQGEIVKNSRVPATAGI